MIKISKLTENLPVSQLNLNIFLIYCKKEKKEERYKLNSLKF